MAILKTLRRPSNWQDFETLCKKLWAEEWNYPETKKNGRSGQEQFGVDICGIPHGESEYYGIQCKGKDEYANKQFTKPEIEEEISKAIHFKPQLKKLYFATTAVKDVKIEQFIREKNLEHISKGLFEIHIYSWEDIVDLIDKNQRTHDWYVKNVNYKTNKIVKITFQNNSTDLVVTPKFKKTIISKQREASNLSEGIIAALGGMSAINRKIQPGLGLSGVSFSKTEVNYSYSKINFRIHNIGNESIEEFKLIAEIQGDIIDIDKKNTSGSELGLFIPNKIFSDILIDKVNRIATVVPLKKILVGHDSYTSDEFYIKPKAEAYEIEIKWKLLSKDFKDQGVLKLFVKPEFKRKVIEKLVDDPKEVGIEVKEINDFIEIINQR